MGENAYANLINSGLMANQEKKDGDGFHPAVQSMESAASIFARRRAQAKAWRPAPTNAEHAHQQPAGIDATAIFAARREQTQRAVIAHTEEIEA
jgi:hypothetical protein